MNAKRHINVKEIIRVNFNCHPFNAYQRLLSYIVNAWQMQLMWRFLFFILHWRTLDIKSSNRRISNRRFMHVWWWLLFFLFIERNLYTFEILDDWLTSLRMSIDLLNRYIIQSTFNNNTKKKWRKEFDWRSSSSSLSFCRFQFS